jgi:hypothetical protein
MFGAAVNQAQRIVLILYCLLLAYCCLWIPWHIQLHLPSDSYRPSAYVRVGYGWLWVGPNNPDALNPYPSADAAPDLPLLQLRIVALSSIAAAGFLLSGVLAKSATRN